MKNSDLIQQLNTYDPGAEVHIADPFVDQVSSITAVNRLEIVEINAPDRHVVLVPGDEYTSVQDLEPSAAGYTRSGEAGNKKRAYAIRTSNSVDDLKLPSI